MLGLSATNAGTPSAQQRLYQSQLQQARREATQAADRVARLEQQSRVARQEAERADERVRGLENQPPRAETAANPASRKRIASLSQLSGTLLDTTA